MVIQHAPKIALLLSAERGFGRGILTGIARYSALNGPWTFYRRPPGYLESKAQLGTREIKAWHPDGIICSMAQAKKLTKLGVPMIGYDRENYTGNIPCVTSDHAEAGRLAARHLLELGHRHFAFCGFNELKWSRKRCTAFCEMIRNAGFHVDIYSSKEEVSSNWAAEGPAIQQWLTSLPKPVGIACANDDRAAPVLENCRLLGFGIPMDISIIGVDDDEYICELQNPPLSSVRIASEQAGYRAAQLLDRMIRGKESMAGQQVVAAAAGVTARQSTDVLMVQKQEVRKALQYIRENINKPIRVSDVVKLVNIPHRKLNEQFEEELGGSILTHLTRARIDYISRLLVDTEMRVQEIADAVGYEDDRHFSRYFKRATGLTPQAYRHKMAAP